MGSITTFVTLHHFAFSPFFFSRKLFAYTGKTEKHKKSSLLSHLSHLFFNVFDCREYFVSQKFKFPLQTSILPHLTLLYSYEMLPIPAVSTARKFQVHGPNEPNMIDFNNMVSVIHQIVSHRVPTTRISTFLVTLISFLLVLVVFATCVMCITYVRRKLKRRQENGLLCRDATSETLIESSLINSDTHTMYSAIDV
ncbi:hypothetical protein CRE_21164 [Caenorhabditis remanei]|uniref:Uncharacterized protein n=1 Tax=Caenorhabditis remanei TaxID=31234 RepID=E3MF27_CAERE|nr:hypothetical protein CRE_21164 [Caenorhabditis remanei]